MELTTTDWGRGLSAICQLIQWYTCVVLFLFWFALVTKKVLCSRETLGVYLREVTQKEMGNSTCTKPQLHFDMAGISCIIIAICCISRMPPEYFRTRFTKPIYLGCIRSQLKQVYLYLHKQPKINLLCLVHVIAFVYEMAATPTLYYVSFMTSFSMIPRNLDTWVPYPYKHRLSQAWDFRVKDKTVARPSYLWYGDPNTGKTTSLYWDDPLVIRIALTIDRNLTGNIDVEWPVRFQWPLLLTWIYFNPSIDK